MRRGLSENVRQVTIPMHLLGVFCLLYGIYNPSVFSWPWILAFWVLVSGFGVAIGYHRLLSHAAFVTTVFWKRTLATLGLFAGQGSPVFWVATHRGLHHPFSDQERDPHSPKRGLWHSFLGWQVHFDRNDFNPRHAIDVLRDPYLKFISLHYAKIYWSVVLVIFLVDWRVAVGGLVPALLLSTHQENIVNTLCHLPGRGYRNFATADQSNNMMWLALLTWGQALHNNHHQLPGRWNFAVKAWEFDPCALIVPLLMVRSPRNRSAKQAAPAVPAMASASSNASS